MAITRITIAEFLDLAKQHPVLDVRSPGEYQHAHIPGAHSFPLFTDEERKRVGTAYKQESQQKAIKFGLGYFGGRMVSMVEEAERICHKKVSTGAEKPIVLIHCWRGGMRSAGVAWLLDLYGFKVYTLAGGYKAFRHWVLAQFAQPHAFRIVGGYTGSGKTEALQALAKKGASVIDLEGLAHHRGSAFGNLGQPPQPSQEMFENLLATALEKAAVERQDGKSFTWLEDESQRIGDLNIPVVLFRQMRKQPLFFLQIPFEERLNFIVQQYGSFEKERLVNAIIRIKKRLGGLETKTAINFLLEDDIKNCFAILLHYYDKFYLKSLQNREDFATVFHPLPLSGVDAEFSADRLLALANTALTQRPVT
ncbi:MAG TPA: tRNA 2-selenouridine(34) synthase MnmH [Sediminibacterium sp.]|nr:tRNA 2-selenouridine(34) synthase MnmH [Sediminibacterium sp.]